jgi:hypothetical protein
LPVTDSTLGAWGDDRRSSASGGGPSALGTQRPVSLPCHRAGARGRFGLVGRALRALRFPRFPRGDTGRSA